MRYAVASHERRLRELNSLEIWAERVAITVVSAAPRKTPSQAVVRMTARRAKDRSLLMIVLSSSGCAAAGEPQHRVP